MLQVRSAGCAHLDSLKQFVQKPQSAVLRKCRLMAELNFTARQKTLQIILQGGSTSPTAGIARC